MANEMSLKGKIALITGSSRGIGRVIALKLAAEARGVQDGDFVVLDYQGYFAGQAIEGGKTEGTYMEVGKGNFNLEFENNLLGLMSGAEIRFAVTLPDDFANPLMAGKVVEFQVKVHEVKEKEEPELNDAFAQNLGGNFKTVADLRTAVREDIIKGKERERQAYLETQVMDQLLVRHPFEVPPSLLQQEQETIFREQWDRLSQHGVNLAGIDHTKMLEAAKPLAERRVRVKLVLGRIAAQEGIAVDDAEVEETLARIALRSGREVAQVKKFYEEHDLKGALKSQLRDEKTMKLLWDKAAIAAAPETPGEQAAEAKEND
jgi:trigger factor